MTSPLHRLPPYQGVKIGLFGGSFNPPHSGHRDVAEFALSRLNLDQVWWIVSRQNPLKNRNATSDFAERLAATETVACHPRMKVLDIEERLGVRNTAQLLDGLWPVLQQGLFVWLMGADSFAELHRWQRWRQIPERIPLAVFDRPGWSMRALSSLAARRYADARVPPSEVHNMPLYQAPAWTFISSPLNKESSSNLRANGQNVG